MIARDILLHQKTKLLSIGNYVEAVNDSVQEILPIVNTTDRRIEAIDGSVQALSLLIQKYIDRPVPDGGAPVVDKHASTSDPLPFRSTHEDVRANYSCIAILYE